MSLIAPSVAQSFRTLYDPFSQAIEALEAKNVQLEAENAKLRRHLQYLYQLHSAGLKSFQGWEAPPDPVEPAPAPAPVVAADESFLQDRPHENGLVAAPDEQAVA